MLCVTQDKLVIVGDRHSQDSKHFTEPQFGKNGKEAYYDSGLEFRICAGLQRPTSGLCLSAMLQPVIRHAGVIKLSIPVQGRALSKKERAKVFSSSVFKEDHVG